VTKRCDQMDIPAACRMILGGIKSMIKSLEPKNLAALVRQSAHVQVRILDRVASVLVFDFVAIQRLNRLRQTRILRKG